MILMRQSQLFAKTKKETPKGAEAISHRYLIRGDFIDQMAAGIYSFLPLGWRVYQKIENIIREEMNKLGGQELLMPALIPQSLWQETGRWETIDPPLFRVKDRHQKEFGLGSTHEEVITDLVRKRVSSYQDLPLYLYQIQNKFRNEMRATGGLLRVREFIMKDFYSFHTSEEDALDFYKKAQQAYIKIFNRCGLEVVAAEAESGTIGGNLSHEFMLMAETGEDKVLICSECGYGATVEKVGKIKKCPQCRSRLEQKNCIENGHTFYLGTKYSQVMGANFRDKDGQEKPIVMGCYGIGLGRLMAAIVEVFHDEKGIIWPASVSPYQIHLLELGHDKKIKTQAEKIYKNLQKNNIEVLYDDRDKSPGEKFVEADLLGIPIRLVVSQKTLAQGCVEMKKRNEKKVKLIKLEKIVSSI
jgi:prolyl-tRNA synthetase